LLRCDGLTKAWLSTISLFLLKVNCNNVSLLRLGWYEIATHIALNATNTLEHFRYFLEIITQSAQKFDFKILSQKGKPGIAIREKAKRASIALLIKY